MNIRKMLLILGLSVGIILSGCQLLFSSETGSSNRLTIGFIPVRDADNMKASFEPIREYIEDELDREVEIMVTEDYVSLVEGMKTGELDIASFGAFSYVAAESELELEPLIVGERQDSGIYYQSLIVTHKDAGIRSIDDLAGKRFAFVDSGSTSGFVLPYALFISRQINYEDFFSEYYYKGSHDQVLVDILENKADAGAVSSVQFNNFVNRGVIEEEDFIVIYESDDIPGAPFVAHSELQQGTKEAFTEAMLRVHQEIPEQLAQFEPSIKKYVTIDSTDYNEIRNIATVLGKDYMYEHFLEKQ